MASTAHKTEEEKKEYFDTKEELDAKTTLLANWIKESKHFIIFTGGTTSLCYKQYSWNKHIRWNSRFQKRRSYCPAHWTWRLGKACH